MTQNKWTVDINRDDEDEDGWDGSIPWATDARRNNDAQCGGDDTEQHETDDNSDHSVFVCAAHTHTPALTSLMSFTAHPLLIWLIFAVAAIISTRQFRAAADKDTLRWQFVRSCWTCRLELASSLHPEHWFTLSVLSPFNGHFPGEPELAGVYWSKGWWRWWWQLYWSYKSCKAPVISSPPTNQYSVFYRPDALPVAQPTVSKHWRQISVLSTTQNLLVYCSWLNYSINADYLLRFFIFLCILCFFNFNLCWCCESMCWRK